jgi:outer membrane lipoprotein-sorting protein
MRTVFLPFAVALTALSTGFVAGDASADGPKLTAAQVVDKALAVDAWGRDGVAANARVTVTEKNGQKRELAFEAESKRYAPPLAKSVLKFSAPADVAGMKFLLVQKNDGDDERTVYMPDLKRSRRVPAANRNERFMGTDFTYADMDRKDIRNGTPVYQADENIGKYPCYHIKVATTEASASYSRVEVWVRKDNYVPLKWVMFDGGGTAMKTLVSKELQKHDGKWQITRSQMVDHRSGRTTEIMIDHIETREVPADTFTVANLEKP